MRAVVDLRPIPTSRCDDPAHYPLKHFRDRLEGSFGSVLDADIVLANTSVEPTYRVRVVRVTKQGKVMLNSLLADVPSLRFERIFDLQSASPGYGEIIAPTDRDLVLIALFMEG